MGGKGISGRLARAAGIGVAVALALPPSVAAARPAAGRAGLAAGTISTVAGGAGGPGRATSVWIAPGCGPVQYAAGHLYIGDGNGYIRTVNTRTDWLRTPAGAVVASEPGVGGPARMAELRFPCAATVDGAGNLVIADEIGKILVVAARSGRFYGRAMTAGHLSTAAEGICDNTHYGNNGTFCPVDVVTDHDGNIVISSPGTDTGDVAPAPQILVLAARTGTFYRTPMQAGGLHVLANEGGAQLAVDRAGNILLTSGADIAVLAERTGRFYGLRMREGTIYRIAGDDTAGLSGDGGPARKAELSGPQGVAVDHHGNVLIADTGNLRVRVVAEHTGRFYGTPMRAGDIYSLAGRWFGRARGGRAPAVQLALPATSVAVDAAGNVVFGTDVLAVRAGWFYGRPMRADGIYAVAGSQSYGYSGDGGPATRAELTGSAGVASDQAGDMMIAEGNYPVRDLPVRMVAGTSGRLFGQAMTAGDIYSIAGGGAAGPANGIPATRARMDVETLTIDQHRNLVICDGNRRLVRVVAARTGTYYGQAMTAGDIYTVAGNGQRGFSGDGGPAVDAAVRKLFGIAVDQAGNLVLGDGDNRRVRVVAARTGTFYGQAMTAGDIYTVAGNGTAGFSGDGGPAVDAALGTILELGGIAVDKARNLVIGDWGNSRVRVVAAATGTFYGQPMTAGDVYTVAAGMPVLGVAVDSHGNLAIAEGGNVLVQVVAAATGTFYGQPMTAGGIYTVAGDGIPGFTGDGGPATDAELSGLFGSVQWLAVDPAGNLLISDSGRIRSVTS